jgi:hypothetical protein
MFAFIKAITQIHQVPQPNKPFASLFIVLSFSFSKLLGGKVGDSDINAYCFWNGKEKG